MGLFAEWKKRKEATGAANVPAVSSPTINEKPKSFMQAFKDATWLKLAPEDVVDLKKTVDSWREKTKNGTLNHIDDLGFNAPPVGFGHKVIVAAVYAQKFDPDTPAYKELSDIIITGMRGSMYYALEHDKGSQGFTAGSVNDASAFFRKNYRMAYGEYTKEPILLDGTPLETLLAEHFSDTLTRHYEMKREKNAIRKEIDVDRHEYMRKFKTEFEYLAAEINGFNLEEDIYGDLIPNPMGYLVAAIAEYSECSGKYSQKLHDAVCETFAEIWVGMTPDEKKDFREELKKEMPQVRNLVESIIKFIDKNNVGLKKESALPYNKGSQFLAN